jgi:DNA repair protein RadC
MEQSFTPIKNMPESERPYEKCQKYGVKSLSDAELLAVIIKSGTKNKRSIDLAMQVLGADDQDGLAGMCRLTFQDLTKIKGVGTVKALQILCTIELSRRIAKASLGDRYVFDSAEAIAAYYMEDLRHLKQEHLILLMLDTKNQLIADSMITKGTVNAAMISPREIFIEAMKHEAVNIILVHNHPSGHPVPSQADIEITKNIASVGKLLGIHLLDHIIIGNRCYETLSNYIT